MPKKPRNPAADYAVYLAVRLFVAAIQAVPVALAFAAADALAWVAYKIDKRHRAVAAENLAHAFPDRTPGQIDRLVRRTYRHFLRVVVEMVLLPRKMRIGNWRRLATVNDNAPTLRQMLRRDRPILFVTGHLGNWEMCGYTLGVSGYRTYAIARVLDNPHLERFLKHFRQGTGQTIIAKKDDFDRLTLALKAGGMVATLADQDAGPKGQFVDYFGRPASTHKAVALMALEFDALMAVVGSVRVAEPWYYSTLCADIIDPRDYAGRPDAVAAITQRYTTALEGLVRRYPDQYFWLHRRWKSQPAKRAKKPQAA